MRTARSNSPEQTEAIGLSIGRNLIGGEVVVLTSELGGGKTTFTHGLVKGIDSKDRVASPTFTISRLYNGKKLNIHHFDFYRLNNPGLIVHELSEVINTPNNVVVIEWPDLISDVLPKDRLTVEFKYLNDNNRKLLFTYPKSLSYLIGNVDTNDQD